MNIKHTILLFLLFTISPNLWAYDDPCQAIALAVGQSSHAYVTAEYHTQTSASIAPNPTTCTGFTGTGCRDVWYAIVVPPSGQIQVAYNDPLTLNNNGLTLYTGACTGPLTQVACTQADDPVVNLTGATPGQVVYVRLWDFNCNATAFDGTISVTSTLVANDAPCNAPDVTNGILTSVAINGTSGASGITPAPTCGGVTAVCNDTWLKATVPASGEITAVISNNGSMSVIAIYTATACNGTFTQVACSASANNHSATATGLTPGSTAYIRLMDGDSDGGGADNCSGSRTLEEVAIIANDNVCGAMPITVDAGSANGSLGDTNSGSTTVAYYTQTATPTGPTGSCTGGIADGGYTTANVCEDAWYSFVMPSSGLATIEVDAGLADVSLAAYTAATTCSSSLTQVACDGDSGAGNNPLIIFQDATLAGKTIYLRLWEFGCNAVDIDYEIRVYEQKDIIFNDDISVALTCGQTYNFYDSGGGGNYTGVTYTDSNEIDNCDACYGDNDNYTVTFTAPVGQQVKITFKNVWQDTNGYDSTGGGDVSIDLEAGGENSATSTTNSLGDYLTFYDGTIGSTVIARYTGETERYPQPGIITSSGQNLTVQFEANGVSVGGGWEAVVTCVTPPTPTTQTITCGAPYEDPVVFDGSFTDPGGGGNYVADQYTIQTFCPHDPDKCLYVSFGTLNLNANSDYIYVYNGETASGNPIAILTGSLVQDSPAGGIIEQPENTTGTSPITAFNGTSINANGCLTFKFLSNNSTLDPDWAPASGWDAGLECYECDLGNGGGADCATATEITTNGFWAGSSTDDRGNHYNATSNPTGGDPAMIDDTYFTNNCQQGQVTRLENTLWYYFKTPTDICEKEVNFEVNYVTCQNSRATANGIQFLIWEKTATGCGANGLVWDNTRNGTPGGTGNTTNLLYCEDIITSGDSINFETNSVVIKPNTDYYIMIDGFTGQHCFFDIDFNIYPVGLQNIAINGTSTGNTCTGTGNLDITLEASNNSFIQLFRDNGVVGTTATPLTGAAVYSSYDTTPLSYDLDYFRVLGTDITMSTGGLGTTITSNLTAADFPANNTCQPITYNIYAIDYAYWYNYSTLLGGAGFGSDIACLPVTVVPVTIWPKPAITEPTTCTFAVAPTTCTAAQTTIEYSEDNSTPWTTDVPTVPTADGQTYYYRAYITGMPTSLITSGCITSGDVVSQACTPNCPSFPFVTPNNNIICSGDNLNVTTLVSGLTGTYASSPANNVNFYYSTDGSLTAANVYALSSNQLGTTQVPSAIGIATVSGTLPTNSTCSPITYYIYVRLANTPADPICRPFNKVPVIVYPQVTATANSGTCSASVTPSCPAYTVTANAPAGEGTLSADNKTFTANTGQSGIVTFTVTNPDASAPAACKSTVVTATYSCPACPTTTPTNNGPVCQGTSIVLSTTTVAGATGYNWSGPSGYTATGSTASPAPTVSGIYTVTVTGIAGCTITATTQVVVNPLPTADIIGANTICAGGSTTFTATPNGASYLWSPGGESTQSITASAAGVYTVTVTNSNGCTSVATRTLTILAAPVANFTSNSPQCQGTAIDFNASTSTAGAGTISTYDWSFGDGTTATGATPSHTYAGTGTYQVSLTITTSNGCTNTETQTVTVNPIPVASITGTTTICQAGTGTPLTTNLTANGGTSYTWAASGGGAILGVSNTATITATAAGIYTVTVTSNNCTSTASITVTSIDCTGGTNCIVDAGPDPANFCVGTSSSVNLNATPAASGSSGTWSCLNCPTTPTYGGATSASTTASGLSAAGTYTFVWTVAGATCNGQDNAVVTINPITITAPITICAPATATFTATGGGTYAWAASAGGTITSSTTGASITATTTGTYTVAVTSAPGCTATASTTLTVNPLPTPTAGSNSPICAGATLNLTASGGTSYLWSGPNNFGTTTQNPTISAATTAMGGTYNVTVTNSQGCTASTSTVVVVNPTPVPVVGSNSPICAGTTLNLSATGGGTYSWLGPNSFTSTSGTPSIVAATTAATGTYTVTVTSATGGCTATGTTTVTVNAVPNPAITGTLTVCAPNTTTLTASGGTSYAWAASAGGTIVGGTTSAQVIASTTGTYTVTVTANNCTATSSVAVTVNTPPTVTITPPATLCAASATLIATGGGTYAWAAANGGTIIGSTTGASITATTTGTYNVIVTTNGCTTTASTSLTLETAPTANAGPDNTVCSGSSTYTLAATAAGVGQTGTWSVTLPAGSALGFTNVNSPTSQVVGLTPGTYTLRWTVANNPVAVCPPAFDEMILTVLAPIDNTAPTLTCSGDNLTYTASFTISGGTAPYTVTPQAGTPTGNLVGNVFTSNPITAGTAFVYDINDAASQCGIRTVTGNTNCTNFQCIISAGESISQCVSAGATATVQIDASSSQLPAGSTGLWSEVTTSGATIAELNTAISDVTGLSAGTYVFRWTIEDDNGGDICAGNDEVTVNITSPAPPTADNPTYCAGAAIPASTAVGTAAATFTWYDAPTAGNVLASTASYTPTAAGTYYVSQTVGGCQSPRTAVTWTQNAPTPTVSGNSPICSNGSATLSVNQIYSSYQWSNGGGTSQSATYNNLLTTTIYTVTVSDSNDCINTASYQVDVQPLPTPAATGGTICAGSTLNLTSSIEDATYAWAGPNNFTATTQNPSISAATTAASGTYTVTVTVAGCSSTTTTTATVNALPIPTILGDLVLCSDVAGDQAVLTATGGSSYVWSTAGGTILAGAGTATVTVTAAGTYSVAVTNTSVCTATATANVSAVTCGGGTSCSPPTLTLSNMLHTICAPSVDTPVSFPYNATTNNPNTYDLTQMFGTILGVNQSEASLAPSNINITVPAGTTAGTYPFILKVYDSATSSCSATYAIQINVLPVPSLTVNPPAQICEGTTLNLNNYITGFNGTTGTLAWYEGTDNTGIFLGNSTVTAGTITSTALNVSPSTTKQYYVEMQTTPTPSCPSSAGFAINVTPAPAPDFSAVSVCSGNATTFVNSTSNTTAGVTYAWNFGDAGTSAATAPTHTYTAAGTYLVNLTATNQPGNCSATINKNVTVNPKPIAAITGDNDICLGETLTLTASGGTSYSWTTPTGTSSTNPYVTMVSAANVGVYTVTATDANNCQDTETINVVVRSLPTVNIVNTSPVCEGGNFSLTASGGTSYQWTLPSALISTANPINVTNAIATNAGIYTVTATDVNGCINTATAVAVVNANPIASIAGDNTLCEGETLTLTASGGTDYDWTTPTGLSSANPYTVASVTTANAGNYVVKVTDGNGCQGTTSLPVTVNDLPTPSIINGATQNICNTAGSTLSLTAIGGTSYEWATDGTISGSTTSQTITATAAGTYVVTVMLNGCPSTTQVVVSANPAACNVTPCTTPVTIANAGSDQSICLGVGTTNLAANNPTVGTGAWSILSQPLGANAIVSTLSSNNTAVTALSVAGDYIFAWTISSAIAVCPPSVDYIKVTVNPAPVAAITGDNVICANETATFTATGGTSYLWTLTDASTATNNPLIITNATTADSGTYSVVVTDSNNCTDTENINLTVNALPTAAINTNSPICAGDDAILTATGGTSYLWTLIDVSTATNNPLIITNATTADSGTYSVVVTDTNGCTDTEQTSIVINPIPANPVAAGGTFCTIADITQITATGAATATFTWYSDANLTNVIDNDATYTPTAAGSVYVTQTVNGCQSPATTVTTTISGTPNAPIANGATYCAGDNPAALTVLNPVAGATITWYSDVALTTQVGTGTSFDAGATISTTTTYYVTQTIGTCVSPATPVTITVNAIPAAPNATSPAPYCQGDVIAAITATGNVGATFTWYSDAALTTIINNTASYTPSASGVFYVTQTLNGCPSVATQVDVVINPLPNAAILGNSLVCTDAGATTELTATGGTSYLWDTGETTAAVDKGAGTYTVTVTAANGCTKSATVTVVATSTVCAPGVNVSGSVFNETVSYNGLSATETPVAGNIVSLYDSNGFIIAQTQTTPAGTYQFTNVPNGTYTVGFATPNGLAPTIANAVGNASVSDTGDSDMNPNGQTNSFAVASADVTNVDAGFVATGSISGIVFGDTNGDGQDTDIDPTVYPNVTVSLLDANGTTIATTTTDINGAYTFDDVLPGNYTVVVDVTDTDLPPTATLSPQNIGNDATDSDIDAAGNAPVTVPIGTNVSDIDAGIVPPATYTLAGTVFVDDAGNGLQDNADAGLKGVTVFLFNANNLNDPVSVNITDDNGNYDFNNLPPGDYVVIVIKPTTYVFTDANVDPTNDINDSDVTSISGNNGSTAPVTISNANVNNVDAGLFVPATIQGIAFIDIDGDGFNDNGTVIPGLTVTLTNANGTPVTDANGATVAPTTTDATGNYQFTNLVPGDYVVTFGTPPAGYNYIPQSVDSDINPATGSLPVTGLTSGEVAQVDGGAIQPATLSGTAFEDNNGNGLNDDDDAQPVANATVTLYNANGTVATTTTTNTNGDYTFTNVLPGTYYVGFSNLPAGTNIIDPSTDSDALVATANTPNVTVVSGSNVNDGLDVGVIALAALTGNVFEDTNYDGLDNNNIDISNVTVVLYNAAGLPVTSTTTDATGNYAFNNLAPGTYSVGFVTPTGYEFTVASTDNDANPTTGETNSVTLQSGETGVFDAGMVQVASISGTVFNDVNANGTAEAGDNGVAGTQVVLYNSNGTVAVDANGVPQITTTNATGDYVFDNLLPGTYYVQFSNPSGTEFSPQNLGTNGSDADPATGQVTGIALSSGQDATDIDAGVFTPVGVNLSGTVFTDANANGFQDATETGVANVPVFLYSAANPLVPIATTATNGAGNYIFTNIDAGTYFVGFGIAGGYNFTTPNATPTNDATDSDVINPASGVTAPIAVNTTNITDVDAGILEPVSISGTLFEDLNGDNLNNDNAPVAGVTVALLDANGALVTTAVTDANGNYNFTNLTPGTYTVDFGLIPANTQFVPQTGDSDVEPANGTFTVTVPSGGTATVDGGIVEPTTITGTVFGDIDNDGQDDNNVDYPQVTVQLLDDNGNLVATTTTDASGNYTFTNVLPGNYTVQVDLTDPQLPTDFVVSPQDFGNNASDSDIDPTTGQTATIGVVSGTPVVDVDAGIVPASSISGTVFGDTDIDGQDDNNANISGITVYLYNVNNLSTPIASTISGINGDYSFTGLTPGTYVVQFDLTDTDLPANAVPTTPNQGNETTDSDMNPNDGFTAPVTITAANPAADIDAGFYVNTVVANNNQETTFINTPVTVVVTTNDLDPQGNAFTVTSITAQPTNGIAVLNPDGTVTYTPNLNYTGTDVFTYQICDNVAAPATACDEAIVTITISPDNVVVATPDQDATLVNTPVTTNPVTNNDTDPNGDTFDVTEFTQPSNGSVVLNADNTFTYTPNNNFTGIDVFTYTICDNGTPTACDETTVTITVNGVNADDDEDVTDINTPVIITVLNNDEDPNGNTFAITQITDQPNNGTVTINPNGTITYTPNEDFVGVDVFDYQICDNGNPVACDIATVTVTINPDNNSVIANNDFDITNINTPVVVNAFDNDIDPQGDNFNVTTFTQPANGTAVYNNDGTFTYTPDTDFFGTDVFTYNICDDNNPQACDIATVTIFIPAPDNNVVANNDSETTLIDTPVAIASLINDTDPEGDNFTVINFEQPLNGTVTYNSITEQFTYTPDQGYTGTDVFVYTICDDGTPQACDDAVVTITIDPLPLNSVIANNDQDTTPQDTPVTVDVFGNDTDPQSNTFTVTDFEQPLNGTVVYNNDGTFTYTPNAGFTGVDAFPYTICDDGNPQACDDAVVIITIEPLADNTTTANDDEETTLIDTPVTIAVLSNDIDAEGNTQTITTFTQPINGNVVLNPNGTFTYTPDAGYTGIDVFTYNICDNGNPQACDEAIVIVTIEPLPDNTVIANDNEDITLVNTPVTTPVFGNDTDPEGNTFDVTDFTQPLNGTVVYNDNGTFTYTPNTNFIGDDVYTYTICDNGNPQACDEAVVVITINPLPNNSVVANDNQDVTLVNTPVTTPVFGNDTDPQGNTFAVISFTQPLNGTVVYNNDGTFTYTPNTNFVGDDAYTYTICDNGNPIACDEAVVVITINPLPDNTVVANNDNDVTDINTPVTTPVFGNDTDPQGNTFTVTDFNQPANGTVVYNNNGTFTYTPNNNFTGTDVFTYTICDNGNPVACDDATVTIDVIGTNNVVIANNDQDETDLNTPVTINVFGNDTDPEGDTFTVTTFTQPTNGTVVYNNNGTFTYTPDTDFTGTDVFTYTICDNGNPVACDEATVVVTVTAPENTVIADNDQDETTVNTPVVIEVLTNDTDPQGDNFTVTNVTNPTNGTATINPNGTITYTPNTDFTGTDVFTYTICDNGNPVACDEAVVIVTIPASPENTVIADNNQDQTEVNTPVTVEVFGNDTDPQGDNFEVTNFTQPANGTVIYNNNGTFTYTPDADYTGTDVFTYTICDDATPQACDDAVVIITINALPDNTVIANNDADETQPNTPVNINVFGNDTDPEGNTFDVTDFTQPVNGTVTYNNDGTFTYTPNTNFNGADVFTYTICDNGNPQACDDAVVTITVPALPVNTVVANNDQAETTVNTPVVITITNNDTDPQGDNFTVTNVTDPANGTVTINANGTVTYTPDTNFTGTDVFTYTICDDGNPVACDDAVVTVTIPALPDNSVIANNDEETTDINTPVVIPVLNNDTDPQGDNFTVTIINDPTNGTVELNPDGTVTYTPDINFTGTDVFTYTICDDGNPQACDDAVVVITIEAPFNNVIAANDAANTNQNTPVIIPVLSNDTDPQGNNFTIAVVTNPINGTVTTNPDGTITYTPNDNFTGTDVFTYTICDDGNPIACDEATITVTIDPVENTVIATNDEVTTEIGTPVVIPVLTNDTDPQGDNFTVTSVTDPTNGTVTINPDGTITYTPNDNFVGTDTITYTICDDGNPVACNEATITVTVTPDCAANPIQLVADIDCIGFTAQNPVYNVNVIAIGGVAPYTYEATLSNGTILNGTLQSGIVSVLQVPNDVGFTVVVTDAVGCVATQSGSQACNPTPVELLSFVGEVKTEGNNLKWITATEINNDYFTLQHATDGINFTDIATLNGNGNSNTAHAYHFLHKQAPSGVSYYRLMQTDFDGTTQQAGLVTLVRGEIAFGITQTYPVPAKDVVNVQFNSNQNNTVHVSVYDVAGKLMATQSATATKGSNTLQIDVANYAAGMYFVTLNNGNDTATVRIVKAN